MREHDESFIIDHDMEEGNQEQRWYGIKNLYHNRQFPIDENNFISITSDDNSLIKIEYVLYFTNEHTESNENGDIIKIRQQRVPVRRSEISNFDDITELRSALKITNDSGLISWLELERSNSSLKKIAVFSIDESDLPGYSYVSTQFLAPKTLAKLWDKITITPNEDTVLLALRIIDPEIERLAFVENRNSNSKIRNIRIPIVKLKHLDAPVPLNSMGDGMSRILQLILSSFPAKNGILLIDEFENGLHFSVQEEVWRMIFKLAKELDMQVFATTHSWDCIESFAKIANESPEEGILLKVSRSRLTSDNGKVIATIYDKDALKVVTATDLEVR